MTTANRRHVFQSAVMLNASILLWSGSACWAQQDYRYAVIPMPTLGGPHSYARAINAAGVVGGAGVLPSGDFHATVYDNGQIKDLGTLGGSDSESLGINDDGWVTGRAHPPGGSVFDYRPFLWRDGQMSDLGTLGGDYGEAYAINELGQVVGFTETIPEERGFWRAFLWQDGLMTALPELGIPGSVAWALNNTGLIVGQASSAEFREWRAALWENGEVRDLGTLQPDNRGGSYAYDVTDAGIVVGQASYGIGEYYRAFAWVDGVMYDLGTVSGRLSSGALAINNLNQIVGWVTNGYPHDDAFIWEQSRGMQRLDELIAPNARWRLNFAWDINDAGQIVGNGHRLGDAGTSVGYLLSPVHPTLEMTAPSPGTAGTSNTITLTNVTPGATVHFLYSRQGGGTRIPGCDLQQNALQLDNPTIIGSAIADGSGVATITRNVPVIARGQTILFQAVVQNECVISQLVVHQFE